MVLAALIASNEIKAYTMPLNRFTGAEERRMS